MMMMMILRRYDFELVSIAEVFQAGFFFLDVSGRRAVCHEADMRRWACIHYPLFSD